MVDNLEACPFCGGKASLTIPSEHVQADCADVYVSCDECEAEGQHFVVEMQDRTPDLWPYEQRDAIAAWNKRATPANGEQVERLANEAALRMWSVHPNDLDAKGFISNRYGGQYENPRAAYYASEIMAVVAAATLPTPTEDPRERVKVLEEALEAWRLKDGYVPAYIAGWNAMLDQAKEIIAKAEVSHGK